MVRARDHFCGPAVANLGFGADFEENGEDFSFLGRCARRVLMAQYCDL
jgi:hypothetical protein